MQNKVNFMNSSNSEWSSFCASEDYEKSGRILKSLIQKCEQNFQNSFNMIIPALRGNQGEQAANGVQQNLGKGPYDQIKTQVICY